MSETYTPGPWRVERNGDYGGYSIESSSPRLSATVALVVARAGSQAGRHDAALIAAAPELLKVCIRVLADLDGLNLKMDARAELQAVITKAGKP